MSESLDKEAQAGNHSKSTVLDLSFLEPEGALRGFAGQVEGVENATRVDTSLRVGGGTVTEQLNTKHQQRVHDSQLIDVEWEIEVGVLWLSILKTDGVLPCNTCGELGGKDTKGTEHSPSAVDHFALTEARQAEDIGVGLESVANNLIGRREAANDLASLVHSSVLIELIKIDLEVFGGLGQAKGIKATITGERAVEPSRASGVGEPKSFACKTRDS